MAGLPGRPDLVFSRKRLIVFCDGDFWHGRNWPLLRRALQRRANSTYWTAKILANRNRDRRQNRALRHQGWDVVRVWETDVLARPNDVIDAVALQLLDR